MLYLNGFWRPAGCHFAAAMTALSLDWMSDELELLKKNNLYRQFRVLENIKTTHATMNGREVILFCGNDYLGLSQHPKLIAAAQKAIAEFGVGTGSARLISGTTRCHVSLEDRIAKFLGKERALVFSSGYLANLGALTSLIQKDDLVLLDKLSHASLVDAAQYSDGTLRVFPHSNMNYLEKLLKNARHPEHSQRRHCEEAVRPTKQSQSEIASFTSPDRSSLTPMRGALFGKNSTFFSESAGTGRTSGHPPLGQPALARNDRRKKIWIVTDSIFSMDGDLALLDQLADLKNRYDAYLVLDEAHGTGVFGKNRRGVSEHFEMMDQVDVHIGTLSKAVGSFGGFVAGSNKLIDYLINHARPFIFETALPVPICQAAISGLDVIESEPKLCTRLWNNVRLLRSKLTEIGVAILAGDSPIVPIVFGDEKKTLESAQFLLEKGFLIPAVRYPTVPKGKARLRITVSAVHQEHEINQLINVVKALIS